MAGRKRAAPGNNARGAATPGPSRRTRSGTGRAGRVGHNNVPDIYQEMLVEAEVRPGTEPVERPVKRRRPGRGSNEQSQNSTIPTMTAGSDKGAQEGDSDGDDEDIEFEDVEIPVAAVQTIERDTDDEEDEEDLAFHDVNLALLSLDTSQPNHDSQVLELDLSAHASRTSHRTADRRKPISKTEKDRRVEIHKTHLLCLLAHVSRRNRWCNDPVVQETLRPLLTEKMETYLNPDTSLPQFGRTQSLKNGLQDVLNMFKIQFRVTERGIRRALWAESEEHLQNVNSLHIACYGQLLIF